MRGGAQSHLLRASDGCFYVVKFRNNPQHRRVLVNEWVATRLAERIGLPVPLMEIVEVGGWLIRNTPELRVHAAGRTEPCVAGLHCGSRYVLDPFDGQVLDYMPEAQLERVRNIDAFAGALAFDKWVCNADVRQAVYARRSRERRYSATLVDQGHCFNDGEWSFPDSPLRGVFGFNAVYAEVRGWESFEPWLSRIEGLDAGDIVACAGDVPPDWYESDMDALESLLETLAGRRPRVRDLITAFRYSSRQPFPLWKGR
jgi:hypothetical protein